MGFDSLGFWIDAAVIVIALVGGLLAEAMPVVGVLLGLCGMGATLVGMAIMLSLGSGGFGVGSAGMIGFLLIAAAVIVLLTLFCAFARVFFIATGNLLSPPPPEAKRAAQEDEPFLRHARKLRPQPASPDNFFHVRCPHCGTQAWPAWRTNLSSALLPIRCFACLHSSGKKGVVLSLLLFLLLALPYGAHWGRLQLVLAAVAGIVTIKLCVGRPLQPLAPGQIVQARAGLALAGGLWLLACFLLLR